MSLCKACKTALPNIPASGDNEGFIAAISKVLSEHGNWSRMSDSRLGENWYRFGFFPLHASWNSLVLSLSHGCPICWTLWRNIRSSPVASPNNEAIAGFSALVFSIRNYPASRDYEVEIWLMGGKLETKFLRFSIRKITERHYLEVEREFPLVLQHTPKSAAVVANRWIKTCEAKHSQCLTQPTPPEHARMPTRLLDLGDVNSRVWRIQQDPGHVPYAALSHRWSSDTPELCSSNYKKYCNFQPDTALPQSYRDIISICRAIPIQYIWIDSLCIIQDDGGSEFRNEAPLMMDIYQYAFLTLSICWDFPGLSIFRRCQLRSIPRPRAPECYGKHDCVSNSKEWVFAEETVCNDMLLHVSGAPINQRAWVLQERCLSRRILYLGNDQLYWECDGCTGSEVSPDSISKEGGRQSIQDLTGPHKDMAWSKTLSKYTSSDLTFENDRLIAIAGLARLVASKTGGTYFAGIWLDSWMQDLLWEPPAKKAQKSKLKLGGLTMVLPSWSWLGFSGLVATGIVLCGRGPKISTRNPNSFESDEYQPLALLSQTVLIPPTSDPFSFFERAILKIRCLRLPVIFAGNANRKHQELIFRRDYDVELSSGGLDCFRLQACDPFDDTTITFSFSLSKPVDISLQYFLLPIYLRQVRTFPSGSPRVSGLLLQRSLSEGREEYTRVGTWHETCDYASPLSPIISNTIIKLGIGKNSSLNHGSLTENERVFDLKLGQYAAAHGDSKVLIGEVFKNAVDHQSNIEERDEKIDIPASEDTEQEGNVSQEEELLIRNEEVECSLLPHFTTAEWGTISLV
ncbi:related to tol protein [Fusarium mangiferae]|uniref:Related to tol protein n=1 Tax=Fusarium mangiferae TaxID=192010 RepID=A0A1L7UJ07_FUSMA|nr:uncharacterized protein FMAN_09655 [Fusarium mangiferae]CVL08025.1 related to tol protein [Fusarium mangiferae]